MSLREKQSRFATMIARLILAAEDMGYEELRAVFEDHIEADVPRFKEYHGLMVYAGKDFCRRKPRCAACPLAPLLEQGQPHG